ncbi:GP63-like protein [Anopheles sinensis]|uniref:GP63-like protein n=1 Tax=Anopheles sinensis TaxID=74873 RepID=A0A084WI22_ANOSI|nr:GP63-like protein [Anopheles sinensis]
MSANIDVPTSRDLDEKCSHLHRYESCRFLPNKGAPRVSAQQIKAQPRNWSREWHPNPKKQKELPPLEKDPPNDVPGGWERNGGNNGRDCAPKTDMRISSNNSAKRMGGTQLRRFWGEDDKTIM